MRYISIENKAIRFQRELYEYDEVEEGLQKIDITESEIVDAEISTVQSIDGNRYVRKCGFDIKIELDDKIKKEQPIKGLLLDDRNMTVILYDIADKKELPQITDLLQVDKQFMAIESVGTGYYYTPKQNKYLRCILNGINK